MENVLEYDGVYSQQSSRLTSQMNFAKGKKKDILLSGNTPVFLKTIKNLNNLPQKSLIC